jgi:hypothetical protein
MAIECTYLSCRPDDADAGWLPGTLRERRLP